MNTQVVSLSCEVELLSGETLTLPDEIINRIAPAPWLISIAPAPLAKPQQNPPGTGIALLLELVRQ